MNDAFVSIARLRAVAPSRPEGYLEAVMSAGVVEGQHLRMSREQYQALVHRFGNDTPASQADNSNGPGAALKALLAKFGIHATPTCKCNKMARQMDAWGPEECLNHIEEIVDVMEETAKKRKLPFLRTVGRLLVRKAIRTAKKAATGT